jgi:hypothetical protein
MLGSSAFDPKRLKSFHFEIVGLRQRYLTSSSYGDAAPSPTTTKGAQEAGWALLARKWAGSER